MQEIPVEELVKKGKMTRAPWDMTPGERAEWYVKVQAEAREYLFSIGQPLVYVKDGKMIAEYSDGRIKVIR